MTPVVVVDSGAALASTVTTMLARDPALEVRHADRPEEVFTDADATGVVVAGPSFAGKAGLAALRDLHRRAPAVRIVLAFDRRPGAPMRDVVSIGAEALVDPGDAADLRAALELAIRSGRRIGVLAEPEREHAPSGQVVSLVSATGGCGKTFLASTLATVVAEATAARVALVDLDLQFGEVAATLGLRPRTTIADLVGAAPDELGSYLDDVLLPHPSGIDVLAAPLDPAQADGVGVDLVAAVLERLRATHDLVLVDTSTGLSEATLAALDRTDETVVLSLLDVASIRNLRTLERTLDRLEVSVGRRRLVINKERDDLTLTAAEVERVLGTSFVARIPFSAGVLRASGTGEPARLEGTAAAAPVLEVARAVLPEPLAGPLGTHHLAAPPDRRRWSWRGRRRERAARPATVPAGAPGVDAEVGS